MVEKINIYTTERDEMAEGFSRCLAFGDSMSFACYFIEMGAIPDGQSHHHDYEQATLWLKGRCRITIGDEVMEVGPGDLYFIPPNVEHGNKILEGPCLVVDFFHPARDDMRKGIDVGKQYWIDRQKNK